MVVSTENEHPFLVYGEMGAQLLISQSCVVVDKRLVKNLVNSLG